MERGAWLKTYNIEKKFLADLIWAQVTWLILKIQWDSNPKNLDNDDLGFAFIDYLSPNKEKRYK